MKLGSLLTMAYLYSKIDIPDIPCGSTATGFNKPCRKINKDTKGAFGKCRKYKVSRKHYRYQLRHSLKT